MKRFILLSGILLILPWYSLSQGTEFLQTKEFQAENKKLQESIIRLQRANMELREKMIFQALSADSLAARIAKLENRITAQQESLNLLQNGQSNLDGRLLTQRRSLTQIAIIVPVVLFLFTLFVLIWFIFNRNHTQTKLKHTGEQLKALSDRLEEQRAGHIREHDDLHAMLETLKAESEKQIQDLKARLEEDLRQLDRTIKEEKALHDARHHDSHLDFEEEKEGLRKGYDRLAKELASMKDEMTVTVKDITHRIKELIKPRKG